MRYSSQRVITTQTARIGLADESVHLQGSESPQGDWIVV